MKGNVLLTCWSRVAEIENIAASVRTRMPEVLAASRVKAKGAPRQAGRRSGSRERLEVELALIAQKIDVDEELDRLESHLVEIRDAIGAERRRLAGGSIF